jgi:hypothetical protein
MTYRIDMSVRPIRASRAGSRRASYGPTDFYDVWIAYRARQRQKQFGTDLRLYPSTLRDWRVTRHVAAPDQDGNDKHYLATMGWTAAWYSVPFAIFMAWTLTFPSRPGTACAKPTNNTCPAPRSAALSTLLHGLPHLAGAMAIAVLVSLIIRLGSSAWRPATAGFASAVIGAGVATILNSVITQT